MPPPAPSRRHFLSTLALGAAGTVFLPRGLRAAPSDQLRIGFIGAGGWGAWTINGQVEQNYVAFCDVDDDRAAETFAKHPNVPRYRDAREFIDRHGHELDGVVITTPDHSHYPLAMMCMDAGLNVYLEKPMATTPWECRNIAAAAAHRGVSTQLGTQGHSMEGTRILREWIASGVVGPVTDVWLWTDRTQRRISIWSETLAEPEPPRDSIDWRLWLADRPDRPYSSQYAPQVWRNWWGYGSGAICDIGMHMFDAVRYALDTGFPETVEPEVSGVSEYTIPQWARLKFRFPARGSHPPLTVHWFNGWDGDVQNHPSGIPHVPDEVIKEARNGMAFAGPEGTIFIPDMRVSRTPKVYPEARWQDVRASPPEKWLPRIKGGHFQDWYNAIKAGRSGGADFAYGAALTEQVLLGALAERTGETIRWNSATMTAIGSPRATAFARPDRREDAWQPTPDLAAVLLK